MNRRIVIVGTLDTKGDQLEYLKHAIERRGHEVCAVDVGVLGRAPFEPTIRREDVALATGSTLQEIIALGDPHSTMEKMAEGACTLIRKLVSEKAIHGVVAVGGSMGTSLDLAIMRAVPLSMPKLLITTVAYSPAITPEMVGGENVMMLPWIAGLWGLNSLSKQVLEMAAGVITGAAEEFDPGRAITDVVGVTSLGGTVTRYMDRVKPALEERGYEVAVFHVTGMSGRTYERAIRDGLISVSLDLSVGVELLNEVAGGIATAGPLRLEAAGETGIPQIVSPGAIEAFHWGGDKPWPARLRQRPTHRHNALLLTVLSTPREMAAVGTLMAQKLNKAQGHTAVVIPMKGFGAPPTSAQPVNMSPKGEALARFRKALRELSPVGLEAFRKALMKEIDPRINVVVLDAGFNDPPYVETVLALFDEMTTSLPAQRRKR
jgi:uncharacterized protein (UPF0261 family)